IIQVIPPSELIGVPNAMEASAGVPVAVFPLYTARAKAPAPSVTTRSNLSVMRRTSDLWAVPSPMTVLNNEGAGMLASWLFDGILLPAPLSAVTVYVYLTPGTAELSMYAVLNRPAAILVEG